MFDLHGHLTEKNLCEWQGVGCRGLGCFFAEEASGNAACTSIQFISVMTYIQIASARSPMRKETISYYHHLFS